MTTIALNNKSIDTFFGFLSKIDTNSKKRLIIKLTESIEEKEIDKRNIQSLFGAWIDGRDSDTIAEEIRNDRTTNIMLKE